eukprot:7071492-Prymnesium_polylepis.1
MRCGMHSKVACAGHVTPAPSTLCLKGRLHCEIKRTTSAVWSVFARRTGHHVAQCPFQRCNQHAPTFTPCIES